MLFEMKRAIQDSFLLQQKTKLTLKESKQIKLEFTTLNLSKENLRVTRSIRRLPKSKPIYLLVQLTAISSLTMKKLELWCFLRRTMKKLENKLQKILKKTIQDLKMKMQAKKKKRKNRLNRKAVKEANQKKEPIQKMQRNQRMKRYFKYDKFIFALELFGQYIIINQFA